MTFEELTSVYPRVERPRVAEAAYRQALTEADDETILRAAREQRAWLMKDGIRYCPDLSTWLREGRWMAKTNAVPQADEFGYFPGQFDRRSVTESEEERTHREWVESYIEGLREQEGNE